VKYCNRKKFRNLSEALLVLVLIGSFIAGCVTLPPVKAIKTPKDIVGTWEGPFTSNSGTRKSTKVIITVDGTFSMENSGYFKTGKLRIKDGKVKIGKKGKMTLHEGEGKRVLVLKGESGSGRYTQVK